MTLSCDMGWRFGHAGRRLPRRQLSLLPVVVGLVLLASPAGAQTANPPSADIGRIDKRYDAPKEGKSERLVTIPEIAPPDPDHPSEDRALEFKPDIIGVMITGSTASLSEWARTTFPPYEKFNPIKSLADIEMIRGQIAAELAKPEAEAIVGKGPFRVIVPAQSISNGILLVRVIDQSARGITIRRKVP